MAPVLSTPFLLYVLLAGTSVDASAIVRPRKAANEIPAEDYNVHDGYHWTGAPGPYGTGAPVPTTTTQAAGGRQYGPGGSSRLGTSCTPSTQTVTLSSSVAVPPVITGAYPVASTNIGYPPAPSSSTSSSTTAAGYESPPFNPEPSGYGAPAGPTPTLSLGNKQPEEYATNTPIVPGQFTASSAWSSFNSSAIYMPTGTGRLPTGYSPQVTSTSLTSDTPYVITSTSVMVYPQYPATSASSSSSAVGDYMPAQPSTAVASVISSGVAQGYPPAAATGTTPPPGYEATSSSSSSSAVSYSSASSVIGQVPAVTPSGVWTPQGNGIYGPQTGSTPTPTSNTPAGYPAVTTNVPPPAYPTPTTLATNVAPVVPSSSSAAGYENGAPNGVASIYAA